MTATLLERNKKYYIEVSWYTDGKRHRKGKSTGLPIKGNKRKAQEMLDAFLSEMKTKVTENYMEITFAQYLKLWVEEMEHSIAESTFYEYSRQVGNNICPWFEKKKIMLSELKPHHIEDFYRYKIKSDGVSPNTVRRYHANIRKALQRAVQTERIPTNPADKVILPKAKKFRGSYYTSLELQQLIECSKGTRFETVIILAGYLGVRAGEACGLRWKDVDFNKHFIHIRGSLKTKGANGKALYYGETKTESSYRTLPMPAPLYEYLKRLKTKQMEQRLLCGGSYNTEWLGYVCVNSVGDIINPNYISRYFGDLLKKHGLRKIRFHDLRHSCATLLLENGATMKQVQEWLGHHSFVVTADTYGHVLAESKKNMADTMSHLLGKTETA